MDPDAKIVLVLDALDECDMTSRRHLLEVLAKESAHIPSNLRLDITSRAHADIRHAFMAYPHILAQELDITSELCSDDILTYFRHHMNLIREKTRSTRSGPARIRSSSSLTVPVVSSSGLRLHTNL
jgi:hypothetical protein